MTLYLFVFDCISMAFLLAFLLLFLPLRYRKAATACLAAACFALTALIDYACIFVWGRQSCQIFCTLAEIAVVQVTAFILSRERDFRTLFTGITAADYVLAGNVAGTLVSMRGTHLLAAGLVQAGVHAGFLAYLVCRTRSEYLEVMKRGEIEWGRLCLVPALFYAAVYCIAEWPVNMYDVPKNALGVALILILMTVSYVLIFRLVRQIYREEELKYNCDYLELCADGLRREAEARREKNMQMAILRHDERHNASLVAAYLDAGETDKIRELLHEINRALDETCAMTFCENVALSGILSNAAGLAEKNGVDFRCEAVVPAELSISEFELAAVAANLTENAIRAAAALPAGRERYVKFSAHPVKSQLIVEVSNPYGEKIELSPQTGLPVSERGEGHGYGLRSVRSFAEKNGALFSYDTEDGVFSVRLLFPL